MRFTRTIASGWRRPRAPAIARGGRFEKEYRIVRPDGTVRVIHAWTNVEKDAGGARTACSAPARTSPNTGWPSRRCA